MHDKTDVVVAGHICLDVIPDLAHSSSVRWEDLLRPGQLLQVGPITFSTGGPVSNTGLALHKLGARTQLMGKVGDDLLGQAVRHIVASHGPNLADGMVVDDEVDTSYTIIISPPGVDRIFLHCPGANDSFNAKDVDYEIVGASRLFHFGYPPLMKRMFERDGAQLVEVFKRVKTLGVTTSLDMAVPDPTSAAGRANWTAILKRTLPYVDVFLPSIEETLYMIRRETFERLSRAVGGASITALITPPLLSDLSDELLHMGAKIVGFKLGDRGLYVRAADQGSIQALGAAQPAELAAWASKELWAPCFQVDVVGTTGAGDATIAGFLNGLLRGMSLEESVTAAVAVGACNVEAADALTGVRPWDETWRRIQRGWKRRVLALDAPGWRFDDVRHMWVGPAQTG